MSDEHFDKMIRTPADGAYKGDIAATITTYPSDMLNQPDTAVAQVSVEPSTNVTPQPSNNDTE